MKPIEFLTSVPGTYSKDRVFVYLDGEVLGQVVEADVTRGYVIQEIDGLKVTSKGIVRIEIDVVPLVA